MGHFFRYGVVLFCIAALSMSSVCARKHPNAIEIDEMQNDAAQGTTPEYCMSPNMNCAFLMYDSNDQVDLDDIIWYCPGGCQSGYECRYFQRDMEMKSFVYSCQVPPGTTPSIDLPAVLNPPRSTTPLSTSTTSAPESRRVGPMAQEL